MTHPSAFAFVSAVARLKASLGLQPSDRYFRRRAAPVEERTEVEISEMRSDQLKAALRSRGLSVNGRVAILKERLRAANNGSNILVFNL